jgi:hypothetical protein
MENKKFDFEVKDGAFNASVDMNQDGDKFMKLKLNITEGIQELIAKGGKLEGAKVVEVKFELTKMIIKLDTDRDGEELLELEVDMAEGFQEIGSMVIKKKEEK